MTITEKRILLTKFMGYKIVPCNSGFAWDLGESLPESKHPIPGIQGRLIDQECSYLKYDTSMDALWPVLVKIKSVNTAKIIGIDFFNDWQSVINEKLITVNIAAIFSIVVEFIEWYNKNCLIKIV